MKNMRVSKKLIVSFALVLAMTLIIGIFSIFGMSQLINGTNGIYNGNYLPSVMAGDISQDIVEMRVHLRTFALYSPDEQNFIDADKSYQAVKAEVEDMFNQYEPTITSDEDRAAFDELVDVYHNQWVPDTDLIYDYGYADDVANARLALEAAAPTATLMDELTTNLQQINMDDGAAAMASSQSTYTLIIIVGIIIMVVAVVVGLMLAIRISSLISKPLTSLTNFMHKAGTTGDISMSAKDQSEITEYSQRKDEIGQVIGSTAEFIAHVTEVSEALVTISSGDLTVDVHPLSEKDTLGVSLERMENSLNETFNEFNASSTQVSIGSNQVASGSQALAQGATEQAASTEELSSSIAEVAEKTKHNAEMAEQSAQLAADIRANAEKGSRQMDEMISAVKEINDASVSISKVIRTINDIAFQTNILALNAAVEAARAGQHGKGFAVVADEVRNLAAKSAAAAKDTESLIANSAEKAELGERIAGETATSLSEIVAGISESSGLATDIARSSEEQSAGISEINIGIDQVSQVVQQNSATAEESAAAAEEMSSQAQVLQQLIARFKLKGQKQQGNMGNMGGMGAQRGLPAGGAPALGAGSDNVIF